MTRFKGRDKVSSWGQAIAKRSCHRKACVAVAPKLAVIMHAIWSYGTFYAGDSAATRSGFRSGPWHQSKFSRAKGMTGESWLDSIHGEPF